MQTKVAPERFCLANTAQGAHISCVLIGKQAGVLVVCHTPSDVSDTSVSSQSPPHELPLDASRTARHRNLAPELRFDGAPGAPYSTGLRGNVRSASGVSRQAARSATANPPLTIFFFLTANSVFLLELGACDLHGGGLASRPMLPCIPCQPSAAGSRKKGREGYQVKGISTHISASVMSRTLSQVSNPCSRNGPRYWVISRAENASWRACVIEAADLFPRSRMSFRSDDGRSMARPEAEATSLQSTVFVVGFSALLELNSLKYFFLPWSARARVRLRWLTLLEGSQGLVQGSQETRSWGDVKWMRDCVLAVLATQEKVERRCWGREWKKSKA